MVLSRGKVSFLLSLQGIFGALVVRCNKAVQKFRRKRCAERPITYLLVLTAVFSFTAYLHPDLRVEEKLFIRKLVSSCKAGDQEDLWCVPSSLPLTHLVLSVFHPLMTLSVKQKGKRIEDSWMTQDLCFCINKSVLSAEDTRQTSLRSQHFLLCFTAGTRAAYLISLQLRGGNNSSELSFWTLSYPQFCLLSYHS